MKISKNINTPSYEVPWIEETAPREFIFNLPATGFTVPASESPQVFVKPRRYEFLEPEAPGKNPLPFDVVLCAPDENRPDHIFQKFERVKQQRGGNLLPPCSVIKTNIKF
ncbi:MAG: hypothetical protein LBU87_00940 [Lactobacillales bacterium]|nr:hypothetical protein [Lactobacillales bacterium]